MLMDALRAIINSSFKENFNRKRKKAINILIFFFISYKIGIKIFLKLIVNCKDQFWLRP